ncbi:MAG: sodium:solute symporter [Planctomycetota bacterium]
MFAELGVVDQLALMLLLFSSIVVGIRAGKGTTSADDYLLGGRSLPWWAILGSIVATETSTATVLSVPGIAFGPTGMKFLQLAMGYILGRGFVVAVLLPRYFQGSLFTAYEVLEKRFGTATRRASSLLFLVTRNLGDGLRLFLAGIVIQTLLGWNFAVSVIVMGIVTVIYTVIGGLRSVVWNDCIQFVIYMLGGIAAAFVIADRIPGHWSSIWTFASEKNKLSPFDFQFQLNNPYTFWAGLIGGAVLTIGTHGTDHMMVQRYLSAKDQRDAGKAVFSSGIVVFLQFLLFLLIGVELACFYSQGGNVAADRPDQIFVQFIVRHFPKNYGLIGLMLAAVLSAAMSTLSSSLNASASAVLNDFWIPLSRVKPSDERQLTISKLLTVAFGVLQVGVGIWAIQLSKAVVDNALTIAGFSAGILLGIFLLGVISRRAGQQAALIGASAGLVVLLIVQFGLPKKWEVAWPWLALIGSSTTFVVGEFVATISPCDIRADQSRS